MATYDELIQDLIDGYKAEDGASSPAEELTFQNFFSSNAYKEQLNGAKIELWKNLLNFMSSRIRPIQETDFTEGIISLFKFISEKIDLNYQIPESGNHWNPSIAAAIKVYLNMFENGDGEIVLSNDYPDGKISYAELRNANAGKSFVKQPYVIPDNNIDGQSYLQVRGTDAITSVLQNKDEMQFTHTQDQDDFESDKVSNKWLRLLMPKYKRSVEVEDLNRNFWVLGQVCSALCGFLFGDNGLKDLITTLLKEIIELWENVLYLWVAIALLSDRPKYPVHCEVLSIPIHRGGLQEIKPDDFISWKKFDDFWSDRTFINYIDGIQHTEDNFEGRYLNKIEDEIKIRLGYLKSAYPKSNLIIIPQIREHNYKHNYYSRVEYPGVYIYNRNDDEEHWCFFSTDLEYDSEDQESLTPEERINHMPPCSNRLVISETASACWPCIDLAQDLNLYDTADEPDYLSKITMVHEKEEGYDVIMPCTDAMTGAAANTTYYCLLREVPGCTYGSNGFYFDLSIDDVGAYVKYADQTYEKRSSKVFDYHSLRPMTFEELCEADVIHLQAHVSYYPYREASQEEIANYQNCTNNEFTPMTSAQLVDFIGNYDLFCIADYSNLPLGAAVNYPDTDDTTVYYKNGDVCKLMRKAYKNIENNTYPIGANLVGYYMGELISYSNKMVLANITSSMLGFTGTPIYTSNEYWNNGDEG